MLHPLKPFLFFTLILLFFCEISFSQKITRRVHDSALEQIKNDTLLPFLINKVKAYTVTIDRNSTYVKRKVNLDNVTKELPAIENTLKRFKIRLGKEGNAMNLRGLNSVVILLKETRDKLAAYQLNLNNYSSQLSINNKEVKIIINDPILDDHLADSALDLQMHDIYDEVFELDTLQQRALNQVNNMRNRTLIALLQCNDILSDLTYQTSELKTAMWQKEEPFLISARPADYQKSYIDITFEGLQRSLKIISIYLSTKGFTISVCLLFFLFILCWSFLNMRRLKKMENADSILEQVLFFKRSIFIASLFGLCVYSPFFFANPTMSYLHVTELLRLLALCYLLAPFLNRQAKKYGLFICVLWLYYAVDDILLESAFGERWTLFIAGILLLLLCLKLIGLKTPYFKEIPESPAAKALLIFTLVQVVLSLLLNLTGRTSLAKILGVSAMQCLVLGITLKIFCAIVLEAIYLQSEAFQESRFSEFLNFKSLQNRFKKILWVLAVVIWTVSLVRNYTLYDNFIALTIDFFNKNRSIGSMTFTFASVGIFFLIIFLSTVISKFVNFFFREDATKAVIKRSSLGSILLLIKLSIWAVGFLVAIAASGIPLDRLSIMIGALSVGIGFGLQNIVSNLVSGIIIAFEQPIKIGDKIEIGNKSGTVKEIGVRSSTIRSGEGANIIIPNGDLLSQHLINWTMQNRNKRVEFTLGISYTADIAMVQNIIQQTLDKSEHVLHTEEPIIIVQTFGEKGIDVRIIFWVMDLTTSGSLRSSAMIEIYGALQKAGIALPGTVKAQDIKLL